MRRAAKNDTRGTIFRLFTILWSHLHEEKHVGSLIAKSWFGQSPLTTVHLCRYACWTSDIFFVSIVGLVPKSPFPEEVPWVNELDVLFFYWNVFLFWNFRTGGFGLAGWGGLGVLWNNGATFRPIGMRFSWSFWDQLKHSKRKWQHLGQ